MENSAPDCTDAIVICERVQRRVLRAVGYDPNELSKIVSELHKQNERHESEEVANGFLRYDAIPAYFNEVQFASRDRFEECSARLLRTSYSDPYLMQRLPNLLALIEEHFREIGCAAKPFFVSTLSLPQANGITLKVNDGLDLVLLSEGVFLFVPSLVKGFPIIKETNLSQFELVKQINEGEQFAEFRERCGDFFDGLLSSVSGSARTSAMYHGDGDEKFHGPGAHDNWKIKRAMRRTITDRLRGVEASEYLEDAKQIVVEDAKDMERQQVNYYMTRGIFLFLLAHEISHVYRDHIGKRMSGFGDVEYVGALLDELDRLDVTHGCRDPFDAMSRHSFAANYQPFETEADADALLIMQKYWDRCGISEDQFACMVDGVVVAFYIMELMRAVRVGLDEGVDAAGQLMLMNETVRNFFVEAEHPCPLSRLNMATFKAGDLEERFVEMIEESQSYFSSKFVALWYFIGPRIANLTSQWRSIQKPTLESEFFFSEFDAMGCLSRRA